MILRLLLLLIPITSYATELQPWFGRILEFELRNSINCQSNDAYFNISSLSVALIEPWTFNYNLAAEVEMTFAKTPSRNFGFDNGRFTGRYRFLNEDIGDPVTLVVGGTLTAAYSLALDDYHSFHHGLYEGVLHVSVGRECYGRRAWLTRYWGVLGVGMAEQGSPWVRVDGGWEKNFCNLGSLRCYLESLWGFGSRRLDKVDFNGYGSIQHQSIDVGVRYTYPLWCGALLSGQYAYRVYAMNYPKDISTVSLILYYPFGI